MKLDQFIEKNKNINRGYRKLEIWKEGLNLYSFVKKNLKKASQISYKVRAQIEDSALSVPSNIAEGYCHRSLKENIKYIGIALSSMGENYTQMIALLGSEEICKETFESYDILHFRLENKLISMNKRLVQKLKTKEGWNDDYIVRDIVETYEKETL